MLIRVVFEETDSSFSAEFGNVHVVTEYVGGEIYGGDYNVIPKVDSQTMPTKGKFMTDDVEILEIPYFEVGNTSGGTTVYIAKEI